MAGTREILMSKGAFARLINVTPSRVSQMISEGKIGPDALEGAGRFARIRAEVARRQIADRTDIGQRFGNGLGTHFEGPSDGGHGGTADPVAEDIKRERLRTLQLANERTAQERLAERGKYVLASEVQAAMVRMAQTLTTGFEAGLVDLANDIAAEYDLPQREVLHVLRTGFRAIRAKRAAAARSANAEVPEIALVQDDEAAAPGGSS